jgi:hypothetical protein
MTTAIRTLRAVTAVGAASVVVGSTVLAAAQDGPPDMPPISSVVAEVELTALWDITPQGAYNAWVFSYGSVNPSVCELGGAPLCRNFGNPPFPTGAPGLVYYLVDNLLDNQGRGTLVDVYFQFGLPGVIYSTLYDRGLGMLADGLFFAPELLAQAVVDLTEDIAVIGPLIKASSLGIWDVYNAEGELVSVEHGLFGLRALGGYALDLFRVSTSLSTLIPRSARSAAAAAAATVSPGAAAAPNRAAVNDLPAATAAAPGAAAPKSTERESAAAAETTPEGAASVEISDAPADSEPTSPEETGSEEVIATEQAAALDADPVAAEPAASAMEPGTGAARALRPDRPAHRAADRALRR